MLPAATVNSARELRSCSRDGLLGSLSRGQCTSPGSASLREDFRDPGRVHLDPLGNLHVCQGVAIGNLFEKPLNEICAEFDVDTHPICGPLMSGGPVALVTEYGLPHESEYADACHLCYEARMALRERIPEILGPDQMYGEY